MPVHTPTKSVKDDGTIFGGPLVVTCSGCEFEAEGTKAMDEYKRAHYPDDGRIQEITKATKVKRLEHYGQTKGRRK